MNGKLGKETLGEAQRKRLDLADNRYADDWISTSAQSLSC